MKRTGVQKTKNVIASYMLSGELIETYPQLAEVLIDEYELHCVNCVLAGFETIKEGSEAHNITGKDFKGMLKRLNSLIN